jgi:hypothetical protein
VIVAAAVEPDGSVGRTWGKARSVVVAAVEADEVADWRPYEVCEGIRGDARTAMCAAVRASGPVG